MLENINAIPFLIASGAIVFDVVSGVTKAFMTKTLSSSIMREGGKHKAGSLLLIAVACACAVACEYWDALPTELAATYPAVCLYVVFMELVSILENISEMNPELKIAKLFEIFNVNKEK